MSTLGRWFAGSARSFGQAQSDIGDEILLSANEAPPSDLDEDRPNVDSVAADTSLPPSTSRAGAHGTPEENARSRRLTASSIGSTTVTT
jgi:hypothetical protein